MSSPTTALRPRRRADEIAVRAIPYRMIEAWDRGSGDGFAAPFSEDADFVGFEGTHLRGRAEIAAYHQRLFDSDLKGSRVDGHVLFVRFLSPELAVMHSVGGMIPAGEVERSPARDSMQFFIVRKHENEWCVEAMMSARRLTLEQQIFWDDLLALRPGDRNQVSDFLDALRRRPESGN